MDYGPDKRKAAIISSIREEDIEVIARKEHNEWLEFMEVRGYHPPSYCAQYGRGCKKCNPDVLPYDRLPEDVRKRQLIRIQNMGRILKDLGYAVMPMSLLGKNLEEEFPGLSMDRGVQMAPRPKPLKVRPNTYRRP